MPLHMALHFVLPALLALVISRVTRISATRAFLVLMASMLIDIDHLLATPVFDPSRCSIGFHPLHTWPAIVVYAVMLVPRRTRLLGAGLVLHIMLDASDCIWMRATA